MSGIRTRHFHIYIEFYVLVEKSKFVFEKFKDFMRHIFLEFLRFKFLFIIY